MKIKNLFLSITSASLLAFVGGPCHAWNPGDPWTEKQENTVKIQLLTLAPIRGADLKVIQSPVLGIPVVGDHIMTFLHMKLASSTDTIYKSMYTRLIHDYKHNAFGDYKKSEFSFNKASIKRQQMYNRIYSMPPIPFNLD